MQGLKEHRVDREGVVNNILLSRMLWKETNKLD